MLPEPTWQTTDGSVQLYHADNRDILPLLATASFEAVVTDPPFGIGFAYEDGPEEITDPESYYAFMRPILGEYDRILKPGGFTAIWQTQHYMRYFWQWYGDGIHVYISAKNFVQLRPTPINYAYDPIIMWYKPGPVLHPTKPARSIDYYVSNTALFITNTGAAEKGHPCPRPLDVSLEIVRNFTLPGGTIIDSFMGSGTIGLAALFSGRKFVGIEKRKTYFDIAVERIRDAVWQPGIYDVLEAEQINLFETE